ncbi:TetR/AcrR family transcriptional regulator [Nocardia sp. NPDC057227]|uniref:TetR/AcrR family transcriptional regulator n=1 Tax=Nocardia sp. NPDC057227 TaxID=3346056 RepID=UPI00363E5053
MTGSGDVRANRRGARSRQRVLDAAEEVMARHGYAEATIPRIVAAAGVPLSSIYHYFGSKEGVLYAVMERGGRRMAEAVPAPPPGAEPLSALTLFFEQLCAAIEAHPNFFTLLTATVEMTASQTARPAQLARDLRELGLALIRERLAAALGMPPDDEWAEELARFVRAALDGALIAERVDGVPLSLTLRPLPSAVLAVHRDRG